MSILEQLKPVLQASATLGGAMSWDGWIAEQEARAQKVQLYRDYADGEHRASLTKEMRAMLRLDASASGAPFNLNHCDNIVSTMADRLELTQIEADNDAGTEWAQNLLQFNRIDGIQLGVHEAAIRDGDTFVMVSFDNAAGRARFSHEEAFDGTEGMLVVYPDRRATQPALAIKVWTVTSEGGRLGDSARVNLYFPDRIEKYLVKDGALDRFEVEGEPWPAMWTFSNGDPIGVPVIHFSNRAVRYNPFGKSEIDDAIPIQDAINRTMMSMVMASELTAFQIRVAKGFVPPSAITPGMWVQILLKDADGNPVTEIDESMARFLQTADVSALEQGDLAPFIEQQKFLIDQLYTISKTPRSDTGSDIASGESLKQREIGLLGKVKRAQVSFGNAWEDVLALAHRIESVYARETPPAVGRFTSKWRSAEIRDEDKLVESAVKIADHIDPETFLETVASRFGWDDRKIQQILQRRQAETAQQTAQAFGALPGFGNGFNPERFN